MNWSENMNEAIDYIESCLDKKIDFNKAAKISCCSLNKFQRLFLFVTDITISEYIRRRRMTIAAEELLRSDIRIIDLAMRYNYDSPEAFTRAYQSFHGYPPSVTRKFGVFNRYERISVQVKIQGGDLSVKTEQKQGKKVIENVRRIGWGDPSANPYVGAITACMDGLNEGKDDEFAGVVSGLGFAYTWYPGAPNDAIITDDAMIKRTFDALGYKISIYRDSNTHNSPQSRSKEFYQNQVVVSIDKGFPVLAFGFTNDYPSACTIAGYENNGEILYLSSCWDKNTSIDDETGFLRLSEWYKNCYGIVVIEEKIASTLSGKELIKHCLKSAVTVAEQKTIQFYDIILPYGLAAYDTMIGVLEDDSFWKDAVFGDACHPEDRQHDFYEEMDRSYTYVGLLLSGYYKNCMAEPWLRKHIDVSEAGNLIRQGCEFYNMLGWLVNTTLRNKPGVHDCKLVDFSDHPSELVKREVRESKIPLIKITKQLDQLAVECFKTALDLL